MVGRSYKLTAAESITLTCGASTIRMTPKDVTITTGILTVNAAATVAMKAGGAVTIDAGGAIALKAAGAVAINAAATVTLTMRRDNHGGIGASIRMRGYRRVCDAGRA